MPKRDGRTVRNPSEDRCYKYLQEFIPKTLRVTYEPEVLPYTIESTYRPDFRVSFRKSDDVVVYLEYKGNGKAFNGDVRRKMIAVKNQHPDKKFCIVFHSDGKIGPKRKNGTWMKQSDWATKHGFEFCIGYENIKKEWFE